MTEIPFIFAFWGWGFWVCFWLKGGNVFRGFGGWYVGIGVLVLRPCFKREIVVTRE